MLINTQIACVVKYIYKMYCIKKKLLQNEGKYKHTKPKFLKNLKFYSDIFNKLFRFSTKLQM